MKPSSADPIAVMIDTHRQALTLLESTYRLYRTLVGVPLPVVDVDVRAIAAPAPLALPPPKRQKRIGALRRLPKQRRLPLAPGSLPQRIVEILQEVGAPIKLVAIVPKTGAPDSAVRAAVQQLLSGGHVVRTGWRYGLPGVKD